MSCKHIISKIDNKYGWLKCLYCNAMSVGCNFYNTKIRIIYLLCNEDFILDIKDKKSYIMLIKK